MVGASGGPDSTALLRCLHRLGREFSLNLHVAHLNHDFRGAEADHDAAFVQHLAEGLGLPCSIDKQDPIAYQRERGISSFEQAAREMRYTFLSSVALSIGADAIALGHTSDDQSETVLIHMLRGSGLHGLRGMAEVAEWPWPEPRPGPLLFRPLLGSSKGDTIAYCRSLGQTYRQDSGNYMWRFTRNKVRHDLLPRLARDYNPRVKEALERLSRVASAQVDFIEEELEARWDQIAKNRRGSTLVCALRRFTLRCKRPGNAMVPYATREPGRIHVEQYLPGIVPGASKIWLDVESYFRGGRCSLCACLAAVLPALATPSGAFEPARLLTLLSGTAS